MNYKPHTHCRVCGSNRMIKYVDLGKLPLSNNLCDDADEDPEKFPLQVMLCLECGLSQLSIVVDPNLLFGHYVYRSSINQGYVIHCRQMAMDLELFLGLNPKSFMIDIAGNDGALLNEFKSQIGLKVLNVDPAENLCNISLERGIPATKSFWSEEVANTIIRDHGQADLITATNVIAHVDDLYGFLKGVKRALKQTGVFIVEFPYLLDFIKNGEFDTIYFEHLSYLSIKPLRIICEKLGLSVAKVEKFSIHGGSVRVHIVHDLVEDFIKEEDKLEFYDFIQFSKDANYVASELSVNLRVLKENGKYIAGFAASAKGNTLLNYAKIDNEVVTYIVDETPEKIGKFYPGLHIPICSLETLRHYPPDYLVILSWNFSEEIINKCLKAGYQGDFIIPIPKFKIIENEYRAKSSHCA